MRSLFAAAAAAMVVSLCSCGNIGKPSPDKITRINDDKGAVSTTMVFDDLPTPEQKVTHATTTTEEEAKPVEPQVQLSDEQRVQQLMDSMTTEKKVAQLFIVRADALKTDVSSVVINDDDYYGVTVCDDAMRQVLKDIPVGGIILGSKNIVEEGQLTTLISELKAASTTPLFMAVSEEGGSSSVLAQSRLYETETMSPAQVGADADTDEAAQLGTDIGQLLIKLGFNLDLAPRVDTGVSAFMFSADPQLNSTLAEAEIRGLHSCGIITAIKYFPGMGNVNEGELLEPASTDKSWEELMQSDLKPFIQTFDDTDMVVVGHLMTPNVSTDELPASMSQLMLTRMLRQQLGFEGVIMTDDMSLNAITGNYFIEDSTIAAINAGADVILSPYDLKKAYNGVVNAVYSEEISEDRINESVSRILMVKAKYGLI
ncbi:MAG: glycoside hydrolase family 3 protein [Ruminococcus sp.]|nr:glycoside hydrolase family 3 protein [Ruminococcus sp.]